VSDTQGAPGSTPGARAQGTTLAAAASPTRTGGPDAHERLEHALEELLVVNRAREKNPSRYRRLVGATGIIGVLLVLVLIGSVLALSHLSPRVVNGAAPPSTTASSSPTTTTAPVVTTIPPPGTGTTGTAIAALAAVSRDDPLTSLVGQGSQPVLLVRTPASTFITDQSATPVVEYLWNARCGACGLENLVVSTSLMELGGTFKGLVPMSFGPSFSSVGFRGSYAGPVRFEPVETIGTPGSRGQSPTPQARAQYAHYGAPPYATTGTTLPFLDVAGHYVLVGSTVPASLVSGLTLQQITRALHTPQSKVAQGILGSANILTAGICATLSAIPKPLPAVCDSGVMQQLESLLPSTPPR
jgi:hypothetical protein